jgi:hypothetical protein
MILPHLPASSRVRVRRAKGALRQAARDEEIMSRCASKIAIAVLLLGLPAAVAAADGPPNLDVTTSCNAAARGAISAGRDKESCLADESAAQDVLTKSWSDFNAADKTQCIGNVKTGGPASYVELLSCLEVMRDAKKFREGGDPLALPDRPAMGRRK